MTHGSWQINWLREACQVAVFKDRRGTSGRTGQVCRGKENLKRMTKLLESIKSAFDLHSMSRAELKQLADEIRQVLCGLLSIRTAHFASNLGVVELCLALHSVFDFRRDRLIWDTGHQIYPHKLVTGRYGDFANIRTRGGLMGYPNPAESEYDLFMTGHAGCSVSTALGLKSGDDLRGEKRRKSVAVIGDGAFPSGIVFEALNNAGELASDLLIDSQR